MPEFYILHEISPRLSELLNLNRERTDEEEDEFRKLWAQEKKNRIPDYEYIEWRKKHGITRN